MKNKVLQSLVEHNNAVFWQMKDQTVAIEHTPSKNVASYLQKTAPNYFSQNNERQGGTKGKCFRYTKEQ